MKNLKLLKKIICLALACATILSFTACSDTSWVFTSGDKTVSAGVYLGYLLDSYYTAANSVTDQQKDIFDQKIGELDADAYMKKTAKDSSAKYVTIANLFEEYKLSFTDKELEEINTNIESVWASAGAIYEENGCGKKSFTEIMMSDEKSQKIFEYYYSENGKSPVSEKERKDYFKNNYAKIKYVAVNYSNHFSGVSTASKATDAQKTELKKIAEDYLKRLKNGESIDKIAADEAVAKHVTEAGKDHASDHNHDSITKDTKVDDTFLLKDTSDSADKFNKEVFKAEYNKPSMADNDTYGYYIFVRYTIDENGKDYTDRVDGVLSNMKSKDFEAILNKQVAKTKLTANNAAIKRFKPQNVIFSY